MDWNRTSPWVTIVSTLVAIGFGALSLMKDPPAWVDIWALRVAIACGILVGLASIPVMRHAGLFAWLEGQIPDMWRWYWFTTDKKSGAAFQPLSVRPEERLVGTTKPQTTGEELVNRILSSCVQATDFKPENTWMLKYQRRYLKKVLGPDGAQAVLDDCYGNEERAKEKIDRDMLMWVLGAASRDENQGGGPG